MEPMPQPLLEVVHHRVAGRYHHEGQHGRGDEAPYHRDGQRGAGLGALPHLHGEGKHREHHGCCGHQDRPESGGACLEQRVLAGVSPLPEGIGLIDEQDGVLRDESGKHDQPHERHHVHGVVGDQEGANRSNGS